MNYVFYDFETSGNNKDFDQILQIGAVLTDDGFQVKDKINISCRLKKDVIPAPEALLINKISIDQLKSHEVSHYSLVEQLKKKFEKWSPACFVGFNSIGFDEDVLRQGLFKSLNYPYITTSKDNRRLDVLKLARAVSAFAPNSIVVPLREGNKQSFKLGDLTKVNQIDHKNAHDAIADVMATLELAKKIKSNAPEVWDSLLIYKKGDDIGKKFFNEDFVCYQDLIFVKLYNFAATFVCFHPVYGKSWLCAFYLKHDPRLLFDLRLNILDKYVDKFIITEATYMHGGKSKKLVFDINKFSKFKDKIIYNAVDNQPGNIEIINKNDYKNSIYKSINKLTESKINKYYKHAYSI